jgi:hypothetical protein
MCDSALNERAASNISLGKSDLEEVRWRKRLWRKALWRKGLWVSAYKRDSGGALFTQLAQAPEGTTHQERSKEETFFSQ